MPTNARIAPFIPRPRGHGPRALGSPPPLFLLGRTSPKQSPSGQTRRWGRAHPVVSHPQRPPGLPNAAVPTLLAGQRLRFSVQTLQVVVAPLLVLLQRALLLVAAAAVVALVGLADCGGGDCKTRKREPGHENGEIATEPPQPPHPRAREGLEASPEARGAAGRAAGGAAPHLAVPCRKAPAPNPPCSGTSSASVFVEAIGRARARVPPAPQHAQNNFQSQEGDPHLPALSPAFLLVTPKRRG